MIQVGPMNNVNRYQNILKIDNMKLKKLLESEQPKLTVIKAPESIAGVHNGVFLAGSIEMGKAVDWQTEIAEKCKKEDVTFFNPRRDDWDSSWEPKMENDKFREQVQWELDALEMAEKIVVFIDPKTTSPIALLELGIHANSDKMCVCCPDGFYRKGNVDIVCAYYGIRTAENIDELVDFIKE